MLPATHSREFSSLDFWIFCLHSDLFVPLNLNSKPLKMHQMFTLQILFLYWSRGHRLTPSIFLWLIQSPRRFLNHKSWHYSWGKHQIPTGSEDIFRPWPSVLMFPWKNFPSGINKVLHYISLLSQLQTPKFPALIMPNPPTCPQHLIGFCHPRQLWSTASLRLFVCTRGGYAIFFLNVGHQNIHQTRFYYSYASPNPTIRLYWRS